MSSGNPTESSKGPASSSPSVLTPKTSSPHQTVPAPPANPTANNSHMVMANMSLALHGFGHSLNEGNLYGRLMHHPNAGVNAYSRVPLYCVRAAQAIDQFEKAFEEDASGKGKK